MKILVVTDNYPSKQKPQKGTFVYELVQQFVLQDNQVTVFTPQRLTLSNIFTPQKNRVDERAKVIRPLNLSLSNKRVFGYNTYIIWRKGFVNSLRRMVAIDTFDVIYCHFVYNALIAAEAFTNLKIPIVVAVGENKNLARYKSFYQDDEYFRLIGRISGYVAVSTTVKNNLADLGIPLDRIVVEPNGADLEKFKPLDKAGLRKKYNFPDKSSIVLFIGRFIESKGPLRVLKAIQGIQGEIQGIFIGDGTQQPDGDKVIFKGLLPHEKIPEIMAIADVFVLPTQHEGSSNVIVEAMGCGLPIISSDIPEIRDQCNDSFSILVDPNNVEQIKLAIETIIFDEAKLSQMSRSAIETSRRFDIRYRAQRILNFIDNHKI